MKVSVIMLIACLMFSLSWNAKARELTAIEVAKKYFEGLTSGNEDLANEHSDVPFFFDGKSVLRDKEQVEEKHNEIANDKGKRKIPKYKIVKAKKFEKLDESIFPEYLVFRITIIKGKESINIYVTKGPGPKVIGFRD